MSQVFFLVGAEENPHYDYSCCRIFFFGYCYIFSFVFIVKYTCACYTYFDICKVHDKGLSKFLFPIIRLFFILVPQKYFIYFQSSIFKNISFLVHTSFFFKFKFRGVKMNSQFLANPPSPFWATYFMAQPSKKHTGLGPNYL